MHHDPFCLNDGEDNPFTDLLETPGTAFLNTVEARSPLEFMEQPTPMIREFFGLSADVDPIECEIRKETSVEELLEIMPTSVVNRVKEFSPKKRMNASPRFPRKPIDAEKVRLSKEKQSYSYYKSQLTQDYQILMDQLDRLKERYEVVLEDEQKLKRVARLMQEHPSYVLKPGDIPDDGPVTSDVTEDLEEVDFSKYAPIEREMLNNVNYNFDQLSEEDKTTSEYLQLLNTIAEYHKVYGTS